MKCIYVCHTYYHVFVSVLKELNKPQDMQGHATMVLSKMSTDFETLKERLEKSGLFEEVIEFDEKVPDFFPDVMEWKKDRGNIVANMYGRIRYTKLLAKREAEFINVDYKKYDEIYVYCDSDPIGVYLNQNRIYYHAVEDGLDTLKPLVRSKFDNRGAWKVKKFFSKVLNLTFICDGYSKYCLDMEVNNIACIDDDPDVYKEVPRKELMKALTQEQKNIVLKIFVKDLAKLESQIEASGKCDDGIILLTEPLCTLDVRERLFKDLVEEYSKKGTVFIKPHPRDELDYNKLFPDLFVFDRTVPMEMLCFFDKLRYKTIVSVYTQLGLIDFVDEKIELGHDFMDKYEDPLVHRKKEILTGELKERK